MKKTKIVFIGFYLPGIYPYGDDTVVAHLLAPAYLKAVIDTDPRLSSEYEVNIINISTATPQDEVLKLILQEYPHIVGYSVYIWNYFHVIESSRLIKEQLPHVSIILGGPQVSYTAEMVLEENPHVDIVVKGSGEKTIKRILEKPIGVKEFGHVPSIAYRDQKDKVVSTDGFVEEDLSSIPSPYQTGTINLEDGKKHTVLIELSRGCPCRCAYCAWGERASRLRKFPLQQVLRDVEIVYNNPNIAAVYFVDSCIFYARDYAEKVIDVIAAGRYKIPTVATLDIRILDEKMVRDLEKINFVDNQLLFGLQAVHPETLRILGRRFSKEQFRQKVELLRSINPKAEIKLDVIFGLPGDNYDTFRETVDFALSLNSAKIGFSPLLLLPGTPFWRDKEKYGFIAEDQPPYMVRSNTTYSEDDMMKSFRFVLFVLGIMYFPVAIKTITAIARRAQNVRITDVLDKYITILTSKISSSMDMKFELTIESNNTNRRKFMNMLSKPHNSLKVYLSLRELIDHYHIECDFPDVQYGIQYYSSLSGDNGEAGIHCGKLSPAKIPQERLEGIVMKWIVSSEADHNVAVNTET